MNTPFIKSALLLTLFFLPLSTTAQTELSADLLPGWHSINKISLKKDVSYLASNQLQGRLSLTSGDDKAIQWISEQFNMLGLKPAYHHSYLQPVPLIEYVPDKKNSYLELERSSQTKRWLKPDVTTEFNQDIHLTGNIVFAGFGITAPDLHYDDYKNIDVRGKIVLVFEHEPQELNSSSLFNGTANTRHAINRIKALNAQQHGAIAILIAPEPNRKHPSNQERFERIGGSTERPRPSQVLADDELQIPLAVVTDAVAKQIAGPLSLSALQKNIDHDLKPRSQLIPDTKITIHDKNLSRTVDTTYNVVGLLEGSDPVLKHETIIISAHHDHDGMNDKGIWYGADDNASGTAGVIALAKAFTVNANSKTGLQPKRSILFVVFAAEERGLLGAFYMAAHPLRPLATTRAIINFDMIGRDEKDSNQTKGLITIPSDTANRLNLIGGHYSPDYEKIVMQQNHYTGLTLDNRFDNEAILNVFFRSDQFPFVLHNIPAFWWFTGFHPDYHQTTDTADKINYNKMEKILRLAYLTGYAFANNPLPPTFISNPMPRHQ